MDLVKHDVAIVGGSLTGSLLALALSGAGLRVCLLEAARSGAQLGADFDGRAYALSASSVRLLDALGLWAGLQAQAQPITDIKVSDGRAGSGASPLFAHFDHRELEHGPLGQMLEDRFLRWALADALLSADLITQRSDAAVTGLIDGGLTCGDLTVHADVIVGCDGRASRVAALAGIGRSGWDYDQTSIVCAVDHQAPHNGVAHQFFTPAGPLAILPLPGRRSSIVWTETRARAAEILALEEAGFLAALRPVFGGFLGEVALAGSRFSYPLGLSLADRFVTGGVALAGDAAHGIHPLAGQGLNLGLRDVAALAEVLVDARRRGEHIGAPDVLVRYQRWRRFDTAGLAVATDAVNRVFSTDNPLLRAGRDLGLACVGAIPGLRRALMREAAGLTGDMPRLMTGRPL